MSEKQELIYQSQSRQKSRPLPNIDAGIYQQTTSIISYLRSKISIDDNRSCLQYHITISGSLFSFCFLF